MTDHHQTQEQEERRSSLVKVVVSLALLLAGLWIIWGFIHALVWAVIMAIAIDPLYLKAVDSPWGRRHRTLLAALITVAIALVLTALLALGISRAAIEVSTIVAWVTQAQQHGVPVPGWAPQLPFVGPALTDWWRLNLATAQGAQMQLHHLNTANWLEHSRIIGAGVFRRIVILVFTLITLFFLLRDRESVVAQCRVAADHLFGATSERILRQTVISVRSTIDGVVLVGLGEGAVMAVFYIFLGVPHPLLMGMLTGVAAIFPFGAVVMLVIAAFLLLPQSAIGAAIAVLVIGLIVIGFADHFIRPVMIGGATKLPFVWVLIGILGGVEAFGLLGLFIGPATMAVLVMLWRDFVEVSSIAGRTEAG
ncbi:AI-2E family transporter [Sphingobium nicotianae]|uniref:AI-2E family transporter n=1 Tax=Sphingobium nicotianae TaxID=2782607 RepID=A0A9X1DCE5_9SPHN|nr:AI-2E family transporter [Sphingobium nicotianae]MBT2187436.1 AI-2E family transporter [Sphingobium nicotianae]